MLLLLLCLVFVLLAVIFHNAILIAKLFLLSSNLLAMILLGKFIVSKHPLILNIKHNSLVKKLAFVLILCYILMFFSELKCYQNFYIFVPLIVFKVELIFFVGLFSTSIVISHIIKYFKNMEDCTLIVLGCRLDENGNCTEILTRRLNEAVIIYEQTKIKPKIILSGGSPHSKIDECVGMQKYLLNQNIPSTTLYLDHNSANTFENLKNSYEIVKNNNLSENIYFITSDFHIPRAMLYTENLGVKIEAIGVFTPVRKYMQRCISEMITIILMYSRAFLYVYIILFLLLTLIIYFLFFV